MVAELPARAEAMNADPRYSHFINRVAVFGSYLTHKPTLGDLDTAIDFSFRDPAWPVAERERFNREFPPPDYVKRDFMLSLGWSEIKLKRDFRIGSGMKVHDFTELGIIKCSFRVIWERDVGVNVGATVPN